MSRQSLILPDEERQAVIPLPFERRPADSQMGWDYFQLFCKAAADVSVTEFVEKMPLNTRLILDQQPFANDWARRKMALWDWRANLGNKMVAAEGARVSKKLLKKLDKAVSAIIKELGDDNQAAAITIAQLNAAAGVIQKLAGAANGGMKVNISNDFRGAGVPPSGPQGMNLGGSFTNPGE